VPHAAAFLAARLRIGACRSMWATPAAVGAFARSFRPLLDVFGLFLVYFVLFGVMGIELFNGTLHGR
jgi:hypothetical protein